MADDKTTTAQSTSAKPASVAAAAPRRPLGSPSPATAAPAVRRAASGPMFARGTIIHGHVGPKNAVTGLDSPGKRTIIEHGELIPNDLMTDAEVKHHVKHGRIATLAERSAPTPSIEQTGDFVQDEQGNWVDRQGSTHGDAQPQVVAQNLGPALGSDGDPGDPEGDNAGIENE